MNLFWVYWNVFFVTFDAMTFVLRGNPLMLVCGIAQAAFLAYSIRRYRARD